MQGLVNSQLKPRKAGVVKRKKQQAAGKARTFTSAVSGVTVTRSAAEFAAMNKGMCAICYRKGHLSSECRAAEARQGLPANQA